jgi:GT2 family glycosyltransferase
MPVASGPLWPSAVWVGVLDAAQCEDESLSLVDSERFSRARLLVRDGRRPLGFAEVAIRDGVVDTRGLRATVAAMPQQPPPVQRRVSPPMTVVVCTRDRPGQLSLALDSLRELDYPVFDIIVVDNHPQSGMTRTTIESLGDPRIRVVDAPVQGLSRARNAGALAATHPLIAFTDDDVVVDRWWLHGLADGFAKGPNIACVAGMVPSGELISAPQVYFDRRVQWARRCDPDCFSLAEARPLEPLFPFQVGRFGTGANFAIRRDVLLSLSGFDEGLGVGSPTGGGEDIDMFVRVLLAGHGLAYEPAALVWHRNRVDQASLRRQLADYGTGLGAWLMKLLLNPRTVAMMLRRAFPGMRHIVAITRVQMPTAMAPGDLQELGRLERNAILKGPFALLRARRAGARARPLSTRPLRTGAVVTAETDGVG